MAAGMRCPRCNSTRIQRAYDDPPVPLRIIGLREVLCNKCGLQFKRLDPLGRVGRSPSFEIETPGTRRRAPRYTTHLPATIHLAEKNTNTAKITWSDPARGHCESISKVGLTLSFVGTRFREEEIRRPDRLLYVTIDLLNGPISAVVSVISRDRTVNEQGIGKWLVGAAFENISENDTARLAAYLDRRAEEDPIVLVD